LYPGVSAGPWFGLAPLGAGFPQQQQAQDSRLKSSIDGLAGRVLAVVSPDGEAVCFVAAP